MVEIGRVSKLHTNGKYAKVSFTRREDCEKCGMCMKHKDSMTVSLNVKNTLGAKVGDEVAIEMRDGFVLKAAFIVYLLPVILVGLTLFLGRNLKETLLFGLVILDLVLGLAISFFVDKAIKKKGKLAPVMKEVIIHSMVMNDSTNNEVEVHSYENSSLKDN